MSKERGGGATVASMSSSAGAARGGSSIAEKAVSTGFSSRGLSAFNISERSVMSSVKTAGPSLSLGKSERPTRSVGKSEKPNLSLKATSFESQKSTTGKTRESTFATATDNFAKPAEPPLPKSNGEVQKNSIEVAAIIPQAEAIKAKSSEPAPGPVTTLPEFKPNPLAETKSVVTQKNLDASVPLSTEKPAETKVDTTTHTSDPVVKETVESVKVQPPPIEKENTPKVEEVSFHQPVIIEEVTPDPVPAVTIEQTTQQLAPVDQQPTVVIKEEAVVSEQAKEVIPQPKIEDIVSQPPISIAEKPQVQIIPKGTESVVSHIQMPQPKVESHEEVKTEGKKDEETLVTVRTDNLVSLAIESQRKAQDDKKQKEKEEYKQDQIEKAANAYVKAGIARDFGDGMRLIERFLQIEPTVLAKNQIKVEKLPEAFPDIKEKSDPVKSLVATNKGQHIQTDKTSEHVQRLQTSDEVMVYESDDISERKDEDVYIIGPINNNDGGGGGPEGPQGQKVKVDEVESKSANEPEPEISFKEDEDAQRAREQDWDEAVSEVIPAFDFESKVPLSTIASKLKPAGPSTNSGLIYQVGKKTDGSNESDKDWRTPLLSSTALVTAAQARITAMHEIYNKPAVVMKESGRGVTREAVELVLSGDDVTYGVGS